MPGACRCFGADRDSGAGMIWWAGVSEGVERPNSRSLPRLLFQVISCVRIQVGLPVGQLGRFRCVGCLPGIRLSGTQLCDLDLGVAGGGGPVVVGAPVVEVLSDSSADEIRSEAPPDYVEAEQADDVAVEVADRGEPGEGREVFYGWP